MAQYVGPVPADKWECEVRRQLKQQLPADWLVVTGVSWTRRGPHASYVRDGQADIVVLAPSLGMVVIEVKGSREFRISGDGCWYRRDSANGAEVRIDGESPPQQATRNMHELVDMVEKRSSWARFPAGYAYVVVYPQGRLLTPLPATYDASTLVTQDQMHDLAGRLRLALSARGASGSVTAFDSKAARIVSMLITSQPFRVVKADTSLEVREAVRGIEILTRQQFAALQGVFRLPRVAVTGPAGSGKTVLALWRLQALLEEGKRAVYLCFNKDLARALRRRHPDLVDNIDNIDKFLRRVAEEGGRLPPQSEIAGDLSHFFRERLPWIAIELFEGWSQDMKFDAVIVDEGQDFSEHQQLAALSLLKQGEGATYTFFADWRQDVFRQATAAAVGAEVVFTLNHNCRNPASINERTNLLFDSQVLSMPGVPEGVQPTVEHHASQSAMAARAWKLAHEWSQSGEGVVLLSPYTLPNSCMSVMRRGHGLALTEDIDDLGNTNLVYFSTIRSFKGIEAASIIVVDVDLPRSDGTFRLEDLYVACTRPTARLAFLSRSEDAATWLAGKALS